MDNLLIWSILLVTDCNWASEVSPTLGCPKCVGGITCPNTRMLKVSFGRLKPTCDTRVFHFDYTLRAALATNRASETEEQRKERRIRRENKKTENHEKQLLATQAR